MSRADHDMTENYKRFIAEIVDGGKVWSLKNDDGWVVCDSSEYEGAEVIPFWSREEEAAAHCVDEWAVYQAASIDLDEFIGAWLSGMDEDGVLVGPNWDAELQGLEKEPIEVATALLNAGVSEKD